MSALIKLSAGRNKRYLGLVSGPDTEVYDGPGFSLSLVGGTVSAVGPSVFRISLGKIRPDKYEALLSVSPELLALGTVACPVVYAPLEEQDVVLYIRTHKKPDSAEEFRTEVGKIPWLARLYLID